MEIKINNVAYLVVLDFQSEDLIGLLSELLLERIKYVVIPESVEKIDAHALSQGTIYCKTLEKPKGWDKDFAFLQAKVYWGDEWEYNEEGIPVLK